MQDQRLNQALELHRKGQLSEALSIYQDLLKISSLCSMHFLMHLPF